MIRLWVMPGWESNNHSAHGGDPFARAVLHMKRADWLDSLGNHDAADSARLWYEHFETIRIPTREALAAEIDWALGPYAMWLRGTSAAVRGNNPRACAQLQRVVDVWRDADPAYMQLKDSAQVLVNNLRCSP